MTKRLLRFLIFAGAFCAAAAAGGPARADAIDGDWCSRDGRRLSIAGPQIVTPKGNRIAGNYSRHAFDYKVPANEPRAGASINMTLVDENTVHLRAGADPKTQVWHRCQKPGS